MATSWVVVTDLDGTLLDAETYAWDSALESIRRLQALEIPIIFCTSKTRLETDRLRSEIGIRDPFIVEDGGAICWPDGTQVLGMPHGALLEKYRALQVMTNRALRGFSEMTDEELAAESGLTIDRAALARTREFDEPFRFVRDETKYLDAVQRAVAAWGLALTRGGRYFHLHGRSDKGDAVRILLGRYPGRRSIALGDSGLDQPMLEAVDIPVAVARTDGTHDQTLVKHVRGLVRTRAAGPHGWCEAIAQFVLSNKPD